MKTQRKQQTRTVVTKSALLKAAEGLFMQVGYEGTQVDEIAKASGMSKGALYGHFKSKEELFLAVYEAKVARSLERLRRQVDGAISPEEKLGAFRNFYIDLAKDRSWALLTLEFKLFAARHPYIKGQLQEIDEAQGQRAGVSLVKVLGPSRRPATDALGAILSALVLEADLEPGVITERRLRSMMGQVFDALLPSEELQRNQ